MIAYLYSFVFKDLMRSKNTSGYFSFYIDNISNKLKQETNVNAKELTTSNMETSHEMSNILP